MSETKMKKAAKSAANKAPAKKAPDGKPAPKKPDASGAKAKKDLANLVDALGTDGTVDAMVIAAGIARLEDKLTKAVRNAIKNAVSDTLDAIAELTSPSKENADLIARLIRECIRTAGPKISESLVKSEVSFCIGTVDENGKPKIVRTIADTRDSAPKGK